MSAPKRLQEELGKIYTKSAAKHRPGRWQVKAAWHSLRKKVKNLELQGRRLN
jgi:hypothetical protein